MIVSLPETLGEWVRGHVERWGFDSPEAYVAWLVEEDRRRAQERLDDLLEEGLDSGEPVEVTREYREEKRRLAERAGFDSP